MKNGTFTVVVPLGTNMVHTLGLYLVCTRFWGGTNTRLVVVVFDSYHTPIYVNKVDTNKFGDVAQVKHYILLYTTILWATLWSISRIG